MHRTVTQPRRITDVDCDLGEGPVWVPADSALYWIDIVGQRLYRAGADGEGLRDWALPSKPGCVLPHAEGCLLLGLADGLFLLDPNTGSLELAVCLESESPNNRLNDGATDARGRVWIGSMDDQGERVSGALYRVDADGTVATVLTGVGTANGLGWSPNGDTFYFTDSGRATITAFDFDLRSGAPTNARLFAHDQDCIPDGLTVDADGYVWSAKWGGSRVVRYAPDGSIERILELPVPQPTSVTFGGPNLDILFISTARVGLSPADTERAPLSGALLAVDRLPVRGLPFVPCRLPPRPRRPGQPQPDSEAFHLRIG